MDEITSINAPRRTTRCYVLVVFVAIVALTASLATRTFNPTTSPGKPSQVRSTSAQGMRQHLDRDASRWMPPVLVSTTLQAPVFYPRFAAAGPPLPNVLLDESLYNRPPPSC